MKYFGHFLNGNGIMRVSKSNIPSIANGRMLVSAVHRKTVRTIDLLEFFDRAAK